PDRVKVAAQQSPAQALAVLGPHDQRERVVDENLLEQRVEPHPEREEIRVRVPEELRRQGGTLTEVPHRLVITLVRLRGLGGELDLPFEAADLFLAELDAAAGNRVLGREGVQL